VPEFTVVVPPTLRPIGIGLNVLPTIDVLAVLEQHDRDAGLGELARDHRAAGAGPDDDDVSLERDVGVELGAAVDALGHVRRLGLGARQLVLVDAAELLVELAVVEVRHLERLHHGAQRVAAGDPAGAPALEHLEPRGIVEPGEPAAGGQPRGGVERAQGRAERGERGAGQGGQERLDRGGGARPGGGQVLAGGERRLGDRGQDPALGGGERARSFPHQATLHASWFDVPTNLVRPVSHGYQRATEPSPSP
jgi:hypothetical protein